MFSYILENLLEDQRVIPDLGKTGLRLLFSFYINSFVIRDGDSFVMKQDN